MSDYELGKAYVQIVPSAEGISGSISNAIAPEAGNAGSEAGDQIGANLVSKLKTVLAAAGIATIVKNAIGSVADLASVGDEIDKNSQKLGISAQAYQEWDAILQHSGSSVSALKPAMKSLVNAAENGSEAFEQLGLSQEQIASMNQEELFSATISALQQMEEGTDRAALASQLLGKSGAELGALLNTSAEDTEAMRQKVHELGGVLSDDAVKASAVFQDTLQDMRTAMQGLGRGILVDFLEPFTQVMDGVTMLFSGDTEGGAGKIAAGIGSILTTLGSAVPRFLQAGAEIVKGVVQGIAENLPSMLESGLSSIAEFTSGIGKNLPEVIKSAGELMLTLIKSIVEHGPSIIQKGVEIVANLALGILNNLPQIISTIVSLLAQAIATIAGSLPQWLSKGVEIIGQLAAGIVRAIPNVLAVIPQLISRIISAFANLPSQFINIGAQIMTGLKNGIVSAVGGVVRAALDAGASIINGVKGFFGIASPSKVFAGIGKFLDEGLASGIAGNLGVVESAMDSLGNSTLGSIENDLILNPSSGSSVSNAVNSNVQISINASDYNNAKEIAEEIERILNSNYKKYREVFA